MSHLCLTQIISLTSLSTFKLLHVSISGGTPVMMVVLLRIHTSPCPLLTPPPPPPTFDILVLPPFNFMFCTFIIVVEDASQERQNLQKTYFFCNGNFNLSALGYSNSKKSILISVHGLLAFILSLPLNICSFLPWAAECCVDNEVGGAPNFIVRLKLPPPMIPTHWLTAVCDRGPCIVVKYTASNFFLWLM